MSEVRRFFPRLLLVTLQMDKESNLTVLNGAKEHHDDVVGAVDAVLPAADLSLLFLKVPFSQLQLRLFSKHDFRVTTT